MPMTFHEVGVIVTAASAEIEPNIKSAAVRTTSLMFKNGAVGKARRAFGSIVSDMLDRFQGCGLLVLFSS